MKKFALPLPAALVTPILHKLAPELGRTDNERLATLAALLGADNQASLGKVLQALYPNASVDDALNNFRVLRSALKARVKEHANLAFELKVDTATKRPPNERTCWFEGSDVKRNHIANLNDIQSAQARSIGLLGVEQQNGKPVVRYFLSYSQADYIPLAKALLDMVTVMLKNSPQYAFVPWRDKDHILPGDKWHDEVQAAIATSAFGLLLVSQSFLSRSYIRDHELPHFVAANDDDINPKKCAIPVALDDILNDNTDLRGLQALQIFKGEKAEPWSMVIGRKQREKFAAQLVDRIHQVLKKRFSPPKLDVNNASKRQLPRIESKEKKQHTKAADEINDALCNAPSMPFVETYGTTGNFAISADHTDQGTSGTVHVLESMDAWLAEKNGPDYCAVLGETGTGKTTTVKEFSKRLAAKLKAGETTAQPLYMDLRLLRNAVKAPLTLEIIITKLWQNIWRSGATDNAVVAEDVIRMVQHEGAVAIFDGLDEVLVHLDNESSGQAFVRELLRILPPPLPNSTGDKSTEKRGRVVLTCRTHYFRTLRQQRRFLSLGDRESLKKPVNRASSSIKNSENIVDEAQEADSFRTFTLLPFTRDQIKQYFALTLPERDGEQIMQLVESVHNLSEIASRPYTLSLLVQEIAQIERWKAQGRTVSNVTLYAHFAASWLERDLGKHTFTLEHKLQLMEQLSATLWLKKQRSFAVDDLDQWLMDFLYDNPRLAFHYDKDAKESLKSDFRTATFVVNEDNDQFRFAHSSLQEYFLAAYLCRALRDSLKERWAMPEVNIETLDFLGQMLAELHLEKPENASRAMATLRAIRDAYTPQASELALAYALHAHQHSARGYPAQSLAGVQLPSITMRRKVFAGERGKLLNLSGANFSGAQLQQTEFVYCDLNGANFSGANFESGVVEYGTGNRTDWCNSKLGGAVFRCVSLEQAKFDKAHLKEALFINSKGVANNKSSLLSSRSLSDAKLIQPKHRGGISSVACSPCGTHYAAACDDGALRLWHASTGECLKILKGHECEMSSVAFAPDYPQSQQLLSADYYGTLRLWHAGTGECQRLLKGHKGVVMSIAFAPDYAQSQQLLSGGYDRILRLWHAGTGECREQLKGHEKGVLSVAFAPDYAQSQQLLSGGEDGTLRLWHGGTGECLKVLKGHECWVWSVAFAPDYAQSQQLLSGGDGGALRLWHASTGECVKEFEGHEGWVHSVAFASDYAQSQQLLGGGDNGILRLWHAGTGECLKDIEGHKGTVRSVVFAHDYARNQELLSGGDDGILRLWHASTGECLKEIKGYDEGVWSVAFAPDYAQSRQLLSGCNGGALRLWRASTGECLKVLNGYQDAVMSVAFAPDYAQSQQLLCSDYYGNMRLLHAGTEKCMKVLKVYEEGGTSIAFAPDYEQSQQLLSGSHDGTLRFWHASTGECLKEFKGHKDWVSNVVFAPDYEQSQQLLSCSGDGTLRLWCVSTGKCLKEIKGHKAGVMSVAFAPDYAQSQQLLSGGLDKVLRLWRAGTGECLKDIKGHEGTVLSVAFAHDYAQSREVLSGGHDGVLRLWHVGTGECLKELKGHEGGVQNVAFAPDSAQSRQLLSADDEGTIRLWHAGSGECLQIMSNLPEQQYVTTNGDSTKVIAASSRAWRYLRWQVPDEDSAFAGATKLVHAEFFGALPERGGDAGG